MQFYLQETMKYETLASIAVGVLSVVNEDSPEKDSDLKPISTAIVPEGTIVMDNIRDLPQVFFLLFGLTYAFHLNYPNIYSSFSSVSARVCLL